MSWSGTAALWQTGSFFRVCAGNSLAVMQRRTQAQHLVQHKQNVDFICHVAGYFWSYTGLGAVSEGDSTATAVGKRCGHWKVNVHYPH